MYGFFWPWLCYYSLETPCMIRSKAGYTDTEVACGWAEAVSEVTRPFGQEQWGPINQILKKGKHDVGLAYELFLGAQNGLVWAKIRATTFSFVWPKPGCNSFFFVSIVTMK